jgi:ribosomal protein L40E
MAERICVKCGAELLPGAKYCSRCRAEISTVPTDETSAGKEVCRRCGTELLPGAVFCSKCRAKVSGGDLVFKNEPAVVEDNLFSTKKSGLRKTNIVLAAAVGALLLLSLIIIPIKVVKARKEKEPDEFIVAEDELSEEQIEEYASINAAYDSGSLVYEENDDNEQIVYYEEDYGPYEWMNRADDAEEVTIDE